jgi:hypothetical protein
MGWASYYEDNIERGAEPYTCFSEAWVRCITHRPEFTTLRTFKTPRDSAPIRRGLLLEPFLPFFRATNKEGLTAIPREHLDKPLWLQRNRDGSTKFGKNGRPVVKVSKELTEHTKLLIYNFVASFHQYFSSSARTEDNGEELSLRLQQAEMVVNNPPSSEFLSTVKRILSEIGVPDYLEVYYVSWMYKLRIGENSIDSIVFEFVGEPLSLVTYHLGKGDSATKKFVRKLMARTLGFHVLGGIYT